MANKRVKPDTLGDLLDGTGMDEAAEHTDGPVQVALVTRAAGTDLSTINLSSLTRVQPLQQHPSIEIDLPPLPKSDVPEDEAAVAIDDVAVDPGALAAATSSVEIMPGNTGEQPLHGRHALHDDRPGTAFGARLPVTGDQVAEVGDPLVGRVGDQHRGDGHADDHPRPPTRTIRWPPAGSTG